MGIFQKLSEGDFNVQPDLTSTALTSVVLLKVGFPGPAAATLRDLLDTQTTEPTLHLFESEALQVSGAQKQTF